MSHFYGVLKGQRGEATRCGTKSSGIKTVCASWNGAVRCYAWQKVLCQNCNGSKTAHKEGYSSACKHYIETAADWVIVEMIPWDGNGGRKVLYHGPFKEEYNEL